MKPICMTLLLLALVVWSTPIEEHGQLHVDTVSGKLCNEQGEPVQLRGMSSHGLQWQGGIMNPTSFRALEEDWNADIVRLSMYVQEDGYETMPNTYLNYVDTKINQATEQGLYVIIDFHMLAPGNPWENIEHAVNYFSYMSATHSDKNNIFYEICNEPNNEGGFVRDYYTKKSRIVDTATVTWDMIKAYADSIVPIIRRNDADNIILVGTPNWCQDVNEVIGDQVDDANTMYTTHFYAASHGDWEREKLREALNANVPVFVTEFGMQTYTGNENNDYESTGKWFALLDSFDISWVNWNFSSHNFSGAVFQNLVMDFDDYDFYINENNMKESGRWIREQLRNPKDWRYENSVKIINHTNDRSIGVIVSNGTIQRSYSSDDGVIRVVTLQGKTVWKSSFTSEELSIPQTLANGIYLLQYESQSYSTTVQFCKW